MKVCILGLWHLGTVISASISSLNIKVLGLDEEEKIIKDLNNFKPPIYEPGLDKLVRQNITKGNLNFSSNISKVSNYKIIWVTYDTPVKSNDEANYNYVFKTN